LTFSKYFGKKVYKGKKVIKLAVDRNKNLFHKIRLKSELKFQYIIEKKLKKRIKIKEKLLCTRKSCLFHNLIITSKINQNIKKR
jgi:hypothetical protein